MISSHSSWVFFRLQGSDSGSSQERQVSALIVVVFALRRSSCYKRAVQDRYAGDIGDFGKFALLRALAPERRLGICWCRTDGSGESTNDGRHLAYLLRPERFRTLDPETFDALARFVEQVGTGRCRRAVSSLEALNLLPPDTVFHRTLCPGRGSDRHRWAAEMVTAVAAADFVFLDPDNGLEGATLSPKSTALAELAALRKPGRAVLLYHHQTRHPGGAASEARHIASRLADAGFRSVDAVRMRPYSSRFYFLMDAEPTLRGRLREFANRWGTRAELFLHLA